MEFHKKIAVKRDLFMYHSMLALVLRLGALVAQPGRVLP